MIRTLYTITALELFLGGGGRLLEFGPVTFRMILFALCFFVSIGLLVHRVYDDGAVFLALGLATAYMLIHGLGFLHGIIKGADMPDLINDAQPSLYWLLAPFFAISLSSVAMVRYTSKLVCTAGVLLAVIYLMIVFGLFVGLLDFNHIYDRFDPTGEIFFRGEKFFFYKGFLYLAISSVFLILAKSRLSGFAFILVIVALTLTLTRGFVVSAAAAIIFMLFGLRRWRSLAVATVLACIAAFFVWVYLPDMTTGFSDQREMSNNIRLDDLYFISQNATPATLLVGEGFGSYINERLNIENSFLWIWWKLGLIGLIFWLSPLLMAVHYYRRMEESDPDHYLACALFYSIFLVYIQTASNPFLNNPIGLSFVLIALFSLRTLAGHSVHRDSFAVASEYSTNTAKFIL